MSSSTKIAVFSIGPMDEDQTALTKILQQSNWLAGADSRGKIKFCSDPGTSLRMLRSHRIPIVLCDGDCEWRQMLDDFRSLPDPPFLILSSRVADDRLWSEALNLGAYDVLAKPYDSDEVVRVLNMAWIRWVERSAIPVRDRPRHQRVLAISA